MVSTYKLNADLLDLNLINSIKSVYQNKNIRIIVTVDNDNLLTENELINRLSDLNNNKNLVSFNEDDFKKLVSELN